jgi:hypothetical protein
MGLLEEFEKKKKKNHVLNWYFTQHKWENELRPPNLGIPLAWKNNIQAYT